jgi:3-oxoacyl-[acyl-carrier-protein] synthase-3
MRPGSIAVRIAGLGWHLPERRVGNDEIAARLDIPAEWIGRASGVFERRYVTHETAAGMAAAAARMAQEQAGMGLADLDVIVGASAAPQQAIPCTAALVQRELGAPEGASACFDLNATCLSFLVAFQAVAHLIAVGVYRHALIFSSEIASPGLNPKERESYVLFGDAAAAAILTRAASGEPSALHHGRFETYSSGADATRIVGGGSLHHPNDPATTPEMNLFSMQGRAVFKQAGRLIGPFLDRFFEELGWARGDVDAVVPHQASGHAVSMLTGRLGFREEQVVLNLATRGNCIAASIPLALAEAVHAGRIQRGQRLLLVGTGAGLTLGALALTY